MKIYRNFSQALTLEGAFKKGGRYLLPEDLNIIDNATVVAENGKILWVGQDSQLPADFLSNIKANNAEIIAGEGLSITPEIVDSHTHLVFGGDRSDEYAMRLNGADYQDIADAGGGILASMLATRKATEEELFNLAEKRINLLVDHGIRTIEIKSGYGLDFENEYKLTKVIDRLQKVFREKKIQIFRTFLAAHAIPKEYKNSNDYLKKIVLPLLDKVSNENLIDFVDIFHEQSYFDLNDTKELFSHAQNLGLKLKIHADEFQDNGGAEIALKYKAISCDHLLKTNTKTAAKFKESDTVATILPGTSMFLGKDYADVKSFLNSGAIVSFASDYNPGSCHAFNLLQIISTAAPKLKINQTQLWAGITLNASKSLDLNAQGAIVKGLHDRFSFFRTDKISKITYHWGKNFAVNF